MDFGFWLAGLAAALLLALAATLLLSPLIGAPPVPTTPKTRAGMIDLIRRYDPDGRTIAEIGAGWGDLALSLARAFPDREVFAYEISPMPFLAAKLRIALSGRSNLRLFRKDGFRAIADGEIAPDSLAMYLCPGLMVHAQDLLPHIPGVAVCNSYSMPDRKPLAAVRQHDLSNATVYVYRGEKGTPSGQAGPAGD